MDVVVKLNQKDLKKIIDKYLLSDNLKIKDITFKIDGGGAHII